MGGNQRERERKLEKSASERVPAIYSIIFFFGAFSPGFSSSSLPLPVRMGTTGLGTLFFLLLLLPSLRSCLFSLSARTHTHTHMQSSHWVINLVSLPPSLPESLLLLLPVPVHQYSGASCRRDTMRERARDVAWYGTAGGRRRKRTAEQLGSFGSQSVSQSVPGGVVVVVVDVVENERPDKERRRKEHEGHCSPHPHPHSDDYFHFVLYRQRRFLPHFFLCPPGEEIRIMGEMPPPPRLTIHHAHTTH